MRTLALAAAGVIALGLSAPPASAQTIEGTFFLDEAASDDVQAAIREATSGMNFVTRPIARSRLRDINPLYQRVTIAPDGDRISIRLDDRTPTVSSPDGTPINWTREDGEVVRVSTPWRDGRLHQRFVAEDGERENIYQLTEDGRTLRMNVILRSDRLPEPVRYTLVFRRR